MTGQQELPVGVNVPRGQVTVAIRRMHALKKAIDDGASWEDLTWHYDQAERALTKAFGLPR